jgi:hypothetical protein
MGGNNEKMKVPCYIIQGTSARRDMPRESEGLFRITPRPGEIVMFTGVIYAEALFSLELGISLTGKSHDLVGEKLELLSGGTVYDHVEQCFNTDKMDNLYYHPENFGNGVPVRWKDSNRTLIELHED